MEMNNQQLIELRQAIEAIAEAAKSLREAIDYRESPVPERLNALAARLEGLINEAFDIMED